MRSSLVWLWLCMAVAAAVVCQSAGAQDEVEGVRAAKLTLEPGGLKYYLIGSTEKLKTPKDGYKLLAVLPGGDGSVDFQPFIKNIYKQVLGDDYLVLQLVAPKWKTTSNTWPLLKDKVPGKKMPVETFVLKAIEATKKRARINDQHVYTLSWSSGGPAAYAASVMKDTPITGSFVAMSVFHPDRMASLKAAKGKRYYILHSQDDQVCPYHLAKRAQEALQEAGATVEFVEYSGGHGWQGDVFGNMTAGMEWLEKRAADDALEKK